MAMADIVQWPCHTCRKLISRNRAYCVAEFYREIGIIRKVNGAYCIACARAESEAERHAAEERTTLCRSS